MSTHRCPCPHCIRQVDHHMLMCKRHWLQVPKELRQQVWSEYRKEPGSQKHMDAVADAIASVQA